MSEPVAAARRLLACLVAVVAVVAGPMPVLAHAELVESAPAANASLIESPGSLALTFSEPIDSRNLFIDLLDAEQRPIAGIGPVRVSEDGARVEAGLPDIQPGVYTVSYQVISTVDGHATTGSFAFVVDPSGAVAPPAASSTSTSPSVDALTIAARWAALAGMLVALGSILLWWNAGRAITGEPEGARRPPWRLVGAGSGLAAVGLAAYLSLAARPIVEAVGSDPGTGIPLDPAAPFGWTPFAIAMRVAFVSALLAAGASLGAAARRHGGGPLTGAVAVVLCAGLAGMSLAGHAAASGGPAFAAIDWLHLVGVAAWLGGLPAAVVLAARAGRGRRTALAAILRRHGRVALVAAPLVALTGISNSPLVLGSNRDLVASDYGNLLVAKAGLLSVALGIGAVNHLALRGRGRAAVAALLGAELVIAAIAVSAAATMVTIQPASARQPLPATAPVNPAHLFGTLGPSRVHAAVSVPAPGRQAYRVTVTDAVTGGPRADVREVALEFMPPPDAGMPPERVELERDATGALYMANGAYTPVEGEWSLEVIVRRAGEPEESISFGLPVTSPGPAEVGPPPDTGLGVPAPLAAAWQLLPGGILGWLPAALALGALLVLGRSRPTGMRNAARGVALAALVVTGLAAGSRSLVDAANEPAPSELAKQPTVTAAPDLARGEAVYRANCASCHGLDGDGDGPVSTLPDAGPLQAAVSESSDAELSYRVSYGLAGTPMPAFAGRLTAAERADLIAYLRERWDDR